MTKKNNKDDHKDDEEKNGRILLKNRKINKKAYIFVSYFVIKTHAFRAWGGVMLNLTLTGSHD